MSLVGSQPPLRRIANLALPLIAGALATNLMTFADTFMVSQLGSAALGGVGIGGQLLFLLLSGVLGLAAGVQAMVARRVGEGRLDQTGFVLNAGILLACVVGAGLIALGFLLFPIVFGLINKDPLVVEAGLAYLFTRLPSILLIGVNVAFRSYWAGVDLAKWSMISIVALSCANVLFNYILIFGHFGAPTMGVAGAGLGSTLAVGVGLLVNLVAALCLARKNGFLAGLPDKSRFVALAKVSYPESFRQGLFSVGMVLLYVLVGQIGTSELAVFHVIISLCLLAYLPHIGFGGAATTLVGESLGRKSQSEAKRWGWLVANVGLATLLGLGLVVFLMPKLMLSLFLQEEQLVVLAVLPLQLAVLAHVFDGYGKVLGSALIGGGATATAMKLTLLPQWLLLLPLVAVSVWLDQGLDLAMGILLVSTLVSAALFAFVWQREKWAVADL